MIVDNSKKITYMLYVNGKARIVSREEWELSWLRWYKKVSKSRS